MGTLKIKINNTNNAELDWQDINNLELTTLNVSDNVDIAGNLSIGTSENQKKITLNGKDLGKFIEESAVTVYIHVNTNAKADGTYNSINNSTTYLTLMGWFNAEYPDNSEKRKKAIKGFLIEHRTIGSTTYHLPYYWNDSSWVLLNAIWG